MRLNEDQQESLCRRIEELFAESAVLIEVDEILTCVTRHGSYIVSFVYFKDDDTIRRSEVYFTAFLSDSCFTDFVELD